MVADGAWHCILAHVSVFLCLITVTIYKANYTSLTFLTLKTEPHSSLIRLVPGSELT